MPKGLYTRNGIFWARFKVRGQEYRISLRTRSVAVAERRLKAERQRIEDAAYFGVGDPVSWEAAVVSWSDSWARLGIKPKTGARYTQSLVSVRQWLDGKKVHEIDNALLKQIVSARAKQRVTNATIRRDVTAISSVLGHCVDENWIEENPAHMMDRSRFKERRIPIVLPRAESVARVFADRTRFTDIAELSLETGMRQEEVAGLEHDRIDRKRKSASLEDTKGSVVREVTLTDRALEIIDRQPRHFKAKWVFWRGNGERFHNVDSGFYSLVKRVARKAAQQNADFMRFRFHDLRHLFAVTYLREGRGTIYALQQVLGHASIKTTEEYLRFLTPAEVLAAKHGVAQKAAQSERFGDENG
jgi:integrase/recombinase XerD